MRSVAGCLTCRRRKLKCDEKRPVCGQCHKAARDCERGELVFRHEQNSSLSRGRDVLNKYYTNQRSFNSSDTWMAIPEQVTFVAEDPAGHDNATSGNESHHDTASLGMLPPVPQQSNHDWEMNGLRSSSDSLHSMAAPLSVDNATPRSSPEATRGSSIPFSGSLEHVPKAAESPILSDTRISSNIDFILNPVSAGFDIHGGRDYNTTFAPSENSESGEIYATLPQSHVLRASQRPRPVETSPEVAFLLRHFSEQPGKWLDLYFSGAYFELKVPIKAFSHPLLKYAACAYAAKHLGRTRGKTDGPKVPTRHSHVATTTTWPNQQEVDWAWYGAKYYSRAINLLRETLKHTHDLDGSLGQRRCSTDDEPASSVDPPVGVADISDETLAAMAILCNFEFMSASDTEWTRHLSGTMLVLALQPTGVVSLMNSHPTESQRAIFWNFFRQDLYAAFILEGRTRLDVEDLPMWRVAGLELDSQGLVLPSNGTRKGAMKDDMISNALIWILSKVFNYIAAVKESQKQAETSQLDSPTPKSVSSQDAQWTLDDRCRTIGYELEVWYSGLPDSFQPCARVERSGSEPATESSPPRPATIPDIWFSSAMCASTMQTYHLARMLLLAHRPQSSDVAFRTGVVFDLVNKCRSIEAELCFHSREIFGIAASAPTTSIMLHQTQTIFVAAQCLVDDEERYMALDILRRVNSDLGWETEYRVRQLLKQWGWDMAEK